MKEFMNLLVKLGPGDLNRGRLNQESDEWWVRYVFKYSVWKSVTY